VKDPETGYKSDWDLLVIVESEKEGPHRRTTRRFVK
jgi:hypothetical protein